MWFLKKTQNQFLKLKKYFYHKKLSKYLKKFKSSGTGCFIQFPIRVEGIKHVKLGKNVSINSFVHIWGQGGVSIGNDTLIASHVAIISVTHDTTSKIFRNKVIEKPVTIGNNVWIGSHCTILPGINIQDNVIIGAGSVVTKNLDKNSLYVGSPAKKVRNLSQFE